MILETHREWDFGISRDTGMSQLYLGLCGTLRYIGFKSATQTPTSLVVGLVKMSALVKRRSWIRISPENAYEGFYHRVSESAECTVLRNALGKTRNPQLNFTTPDAGNIILMT